MCKSCLIIALLFCLTVIGAVFFIWNNANGQTGSIIINEIAWMGSPPEANETTSQAANDEWVELFNASGAPINLSDWILQSTDGKPTIALSGSIGAGKYILLSRANKTVGGIVADLVYAYSSNALKNSGEHLQLLDGSGNIVDEVNAASGWFAGDNATKETMERKDAATSGSDSVNWINGPVGGTPRAINSKSQMINDEEGAGSESPGLDSSQQGGQIANGEEQKNTSTTSKNEQSDTEELSKEISQESPQFIKTTDLIINEFVPNPQGADADLEWIEIFNRGSESYNLSNWYLDDREGASAPFQLPAGTMIAPGGYLVYPAPTTRIALTNSGDTVRLLYPDGTIAYEVKYTKKAKEGYAYALINTQWHWTSVLTPGSANIPDIPKTKTSGLQGTSAPPISNKINNEESQKKELAETEVQTLSTSQFSAQLAQKSSFSPGIILIFLSAGIISAIAGVSFVLLKNKKR